jgi:hypothetical protein
MRLGPSSTTLCQGTSKSKENLTFFLSMDLLQPPMKADIQRQNF